MPTINFEFKAKAENIEGLEKKLQLKNPVFIGEDHQTDTYFNVAIGRLKLREGIIENALIYYERENTKNAKQSNILLYKHHPDQNLKDILIKVNGVKTVVRKARRVYFIGNVKFHFDRLDGLGTFLEVEAIDEDGSVGVETLKKQCDEYAAFFEIDPSDYLSQSYSDMIL